ncbi:hypothetical protein ACFLYR_08785 [Chloroflexota bacterium]
MPNAAADASKHTPAPTSLLLSIELIANTQLPNPVISEPHKADLFNITCSFPILIARKGTTIFLTTHYIEEAERLYERIAFIVNSRIVQTDRTSDLLCAKRRDLHTASGHPRIGWLVRDRVV